VARCRRDTVPLVLRLVPPAQGRVQRRISLPIARVQVRRKRRARRVTTAVATLGLPGFLAAVGKAGGARKDAEDGADRGGMASVGRNVQNGPPARILEQHRRRERVRAKATRKGGLIIIGLVAVE
jgi:hypothetical protein